MNREKIKEYLTILNDLSNDLGIETYKELEIAILLFLRSDLEDFDYLTDNQLNRLYDLTDYGASLLDLEKEEVDYILNNEEEEEDNE